MFFTYVKISQEMFIFNKCATSFKIRRKFNYLFEFDVSKEATRELSANSLRRINISTYVGIQLKIIIRKMFQLITFLHQFKHLVKNSARYLNYYLQNTLMTSWRAKLS